jgi:HTH-type transcriptional regulator/antitoxin HigA
MEVRVIRNDDDLTAAFAEIEALWGAEQGTEAGDKLDALIALTIAYESRHYPVPKTPAVEALKDAIEQAGRSQADLARLLGSRSRASEVLNGRRPLMLDQVRLLAKEWGIPTGALIDLDATQQKGVSSKDQSHGASTTSEKLCAFCSSPSGGRNKSREHVLPNWLNGYLPYPVDKYHEQEIQTVTSTPEGEQRSGGHRRWAGDFGSRKVPGICKHCNNGWMSRLEESIKPTLLQLIEGKAVRPEPEILTLLSTWIVKTAMTNELTGLKRIPSSQKERTYLMEHQEPPPGWQVLIARQDSPFWRKRFAYYEAGMNIEGRPPATEAYSPLDAFTTTFSIGQFAAHTLCVRQPDLAKRLQIPEEYRGRLRIWPLPSGDFQWPTNPVLTHHGMWNLSYGLLHSLNELGANMPSRPF